MCKIFPQQQWVFSRIRNERFRGNPGILLQFFTVYKGYFVTVTEALKNESVTSLLL
jgi:hypothetical protein